MESGLPLECNQINLTFVLGEILYQFICELLLGSYHKRTRDAVKDGKVCLAVILVILRQKHQRKILIEI